MFRTTLTQRTTNFSRLHQNVLHKALLVTPTRSGAMMMLSGKYTTHIRALSGMSASSSSSSSESSESSLGKSVPSSVSFSSSSRQIVRGVISSSTTSKNHHHHHHHHHHPLRSTTSARASVSSSSIVRFNNTTTNSTRRSRAIQSISLKDDCNNTSRKGTTTRRSNNSIRLLATESENGSSSQTADVEKKNTAEKKKSNYPKLHVQTNGRVVAIGDLHGDIQQARRALRIAGVLGKDDDDNVNPQWVGGDTVLVQVGDVLDRGDDEIGILILLQKLGKAARKAGGDVFVLNGNHEVLNISGDFRYVSRGAFHESMRFSDHLVKLFGKDAVPGRRRRRSSKQEDGEEEEEEEEEEDEMDEWRKQTNARVGLFSPGGPLAQQLSMHNTVLIVNDTVFAHGGLVPRHVDFGLDKLNKSVSEWMRGKRIEDEDTKVALGMAIGGVKDSVVWHRAYGTEHYATNTERTNACTLLSRTLEKINEIEGIPVKRLVVGHTPQMQGANCECDGKIWRVDVGMSFGVLGANPQVLEIIGDEVKILTREVPVTMSKL